MRMAWAALWAITTVIFAVAALSIITRVVRRRKSTPAASSSRTEATPESGLSGPDTVIALFALAASVFFGVMALPDDAPRPGGPLPTTPVRTQETVLQPPSSSAARTRSPTPDVVKIVKLENNPGVVAVTVQVDGPPSQGTEYLLIAHFRGSYQLKGRISADIGRHVVEADVKLAAPGSWRDFFVVRATPEAVASWDLSAGEPLLEIPPGSTTISQEVPHQMPR